MHNYNKTISRFDNLNEFDVSKKKIIIPQHIYKLLNKLKNFDSKENVQHILRLSATSVKQDPDLRNIFDFFCWNEERRVFDKEIRQEDLVKKIESTYDLKLDELMLEDKVDGEDDPNINRKESANSNFTLNRTNSNNPQLIYNNSLGEDLSFSQNRTDAVESIFHVQKPIAISNSQGLDRNTMHHEFNDVFLTNSAKFGWNQHSLNIGDEESSLLSNWRKSNKLPQKTKTPSFNTDDDNKGNFTEEINSNMILNNYSSNLRHNVGVKNYVIGDRNYSDFIKTLKSGDDTQKYSLLNQNYSNFQRQTVPNLINNDNLSGPSFGATPNSFTPQIILGNQNNKDFKVSTFKVENKKRNKKELKKILSKKGNKQVKVKTPTRIKKLRDNHKPKNLENSLRSSHFGLKEISKKVKEIVKKLKKTTYKEISDLIVSQLNEKDGKDEKNIRRRIYDSLNVMKAMNLFEKDPTNKFIIWKGDKLNNSTNDNVTLSNFSFKKRKRSMLDEDEIENGSVSVDELKYIIKYKKEEYNRKYAMAQQLWEQRNIFKDLLERNEEQKTKISEDEKITFPFIIIEFPETKNSSNINIIANDNKSQIHFSLDNPVNIYGDLDALKKINNKLSVHGSSKI